MSLTTYVPADDPGWANVGMGVTPNATYLGNGWILFAGHYGPSQFAGTVSYMFNGVTVNTIVGQWYPVPNPTNDPKYPGLSANTDLTLMRVDGNPGLNPLTIASQPLTTADLTQPTSLVTFIGQGHTGEANLTNWNVNDAPNTTWSWTPTPTGGNYHGYKVQGDVTKRWGLNRITNENSLFSENDTDLQSKVHLNETGNDVISMFTAYDNGGANECKGPNWIRERLCSTRMLRRSGN